MTGMANAERPGITTELLDKLGDAVTMVGRDWVYTYVSPGAARIIGAPADEIVGRNAWDVFPEVVGTPEYDAMIRAMTNGTAEKIVWFFDSVDRWYEQQAIPVTAGLVIVVSDVTDREIVVRRSSQLLEIGEALAGTLTVDDVGRVVGTHALRLVGAVAGTVVLVDPVRELATAVEWTGLDRTDAAAWRTFPTHPATPSVDAFRTGEAVTVGGYDEIAARYPHLLDIVRRNGHQSIAAFPLAVAKERLGALSLLFASERAFARVDRELIATVAAMTAQALARAQLYDAAQRSVGALQRSLLPLQLPLIDGLDVATRYQASEATADVGGDWFDVVPLHAGAVGIVMGDVEGHDLAAAALMGLVRSAVRAYAIEEHPPAVILSRANMFLAGLGAGRLVTVSYSQVHPGERLITTVSAGHLPAMIASRNGEVHDVPSEIGPPLGVVVGEMLWPESTSTMPPGAVVAVFTDGLVETRTDGIDVGLDRVRAALLAGRDDPVEVLADRLLGDRVLGGEDDVALVIARVTAPVDADRVISRRLPPTPASVSLARRFVRQLLAEWGVAQDTSDDVELALSEIVTNAARHSEDTLDLQLSCTEECVWFAVSDTSHRMPAGAETADHDATAGRGLNLVEAVSSRWGIESDGLSKTVWCAFDRS